VAVSAAGFGPDEPALVFVATGAAFPDGLAAAGVAGRSHAPLLLVRPDALPGVVAAELRRLNPSTVVVLGSTGAVSAGVVSAIRALWP
jgi:putative cell wall-binding protein